MTVFLNDPKGDNPFATIGCKDWNTIASKVEFSEAVFRKEENGYTVFCWASNLTDVQKFGEPKFVFQPCLLTFTLHASDYEKNVKKDDGSYTKVATKASPVEIFFCNQLDQTEQGKFYRGMFDLRNHQETFDVVTTGKAANGDELPESAIAFVKSCVIKLEPTEPEKLKDLVLPAASGGGKKGWGSGGGKSQLESERLKDRFEFVKLHLGSYGEGANNLVELSLGLSQMKNDLGDETLEAFGVLINVLLK
jgi:hypothetical protein